MAVSSGFYNSLNGDRKYNAEQLSSIFDGVIEDGVYASIYDKTDTNPRPFKIIPDEENNLQVIVKKGRAWFNHTWLYNDDDIILELAGVPSSGQSRIDLVVIRVDTENRVNTIEVLTGTAAAESPTAPSTKDGVNGIYEYELGRITVDNDTTIIDEADIDQTAIGTTTPYVTAPVQSISLTDYLGDWETEFDNWLNTQDTRVDGFLANISGLLTQEQAGYLLDLIDHMHMVTLKAEYDASSESQIGRYVLCTNGNRTFTTTTDDSGEVVFRIGDQRADQTLGVDYDSCLGDWSITMYKSSSDLTPLGATRTINTYYYGEYPAVTIGGEEEEENDLSFVLAVGSTEYSFSDASDSSNVANVYAYTKDATTGNWDLIIYKDSTLTFASLGTNLDVCLVGGGGGGGGGYGNLSAGKGVYGGYGGGARITNEYGETFAEETAYSIAIGAGGSKGKGNGTTGNDTATNGGGGGTTSISANSTTLYSAAGGTRGNRATSSMSNGGHATNGGNGDGPTMCFGNSAGYPTVSGQNNNSKYGGGGNRGAYTVYSSAQGGYQEGKDGTAGKQGLVIIRNARSA